MINDVRKLNWHIEATATQNTILQLPSTYLLSIYLRKPMSGVTKVESTVSYNVTTLTSLLHQVSKHHIIIISNVMFIWNALSCIDEIMGKAVW